MSARVRDVIVSAPGHTPGVDVRALLTDVAGLGPFFTVDAGPAVRGERPLTDLYTDPQPLRDRIAHVGGALGCDERVAASLAFQGLAAQLVSAPYAAAVLHGAVPALTPATVWWRRADDGGWRLRSAATALTGPAELAALLDGLLAPLVTAVRAQVTVAEQLLWGNAASTVAAAKRLLVLQRPAAADQAAEVARAVLGSGHLAGAGELEAPRHPDRNWSFRRRSCCLYYRVPDGGFCEDCVLSSDRG